jgi:hemolysin type calcium-binding protein
MHIVQLDLAICHITYNKSEGRVVISRVYMSRNLVVSLCMVFVAFAIVAKVSTGIEQVAYAQIWGFSPTISNRNLGNLEVSNNSVPQNNNNNNKEKISITSNCIARVPDSHHTGVSSSIGRSNSISSFSSYSSVPSAKKLSSDVDPGIYNSCRKIAVSHNPTSSVTTANSVRKSNNALKDISTSCIQKTCRVNHNNHKNSKEGDLTYLSQNRIASGLNLPKNLIVPSCRGAGSTTTTTTGTGANTCPPIVGTNGPDIIIATAVPSATIYGLEGNDVIQCGPGDCIVYSGPGDNIMMSSSSNTPKLFGGSGNNVFIGSGGDSLMVGGNGDDQFYGGGGHDVMIGGGGTNYFDCGPNGNGVILDFNPKNGDTKAPNCKFTITANTGVVPLPPQ